MYRKAGVVLLAIGLLVIILGAGRVAKKEVELELVWEKEFDKKIEKVAFGETEDGKLYPKIVVFEDEVRFYDEKSNLLARQPYRKYMRITLSKKGNYIGIPTVIKKKSKGKRGLLKFTVYTDRGEKLWEREEETVYDYPAYGRCISSNDGSAVRLDHPAGRLLFLDSKGKAIKKVDLFKDDEWDIEKGIPDYTFSEEGEYFVVNANRGVPVSIGGYSEDHPGVSANPHLILFTNKGMEIWRHELPVFSGNGVEISSRGEKIIGTGTTSHIKTGAADACTWLINKNGKIINKFGFFSRNIKFSPDEKYIVVDYWDPNKTILLIKSETGEVLQKYKLEETVGKTVNLDVSNDGKVLVALGHKIYSPRPKRRLSAVPQIRLYNCSGKKIYEKSFPGERFVKARTVFSENGKYVMIPTDKKIELLKIFRK